MFYKCNYKWSVFFHDNFVQNPKKKKSPVPVCLTFIQIRCFYICTCEFKILKKHVFFFIKVDKDFDENLSSTNSGKKNGTSSKSISSLFFFLVLELIFILPPTFLNTFFHKKNCFWIFTEIKTETQILNFNWIPNYSFPLRWKMMNFDIFLHFFIIIWFWIYLRKIKFSKKTDCDS